MTIAEARARFSGPLLTHYLGAAQHPPDADSTLLLLFEQRTQSAVLLESVVTARSTTLFARFERVGKDELFPPPDLRHSTTYTVSELDLGALRQVLEVSGVGLGFGATMSTYWVPDDLGTTYGRSLRSYMLYARLSL